MYSMLAAVAVPFIFPFDFKIAPPPIKPIHVVIP